MRRERLGERAQGAVWRLARDRGPELEPRPHWGRSPGCEVADNITLACGECKQRNYTSQKNKATHRERLVLKKYCRFCRKHTKHQETR